MRSGMKYASLTTYKGTFLHLFLVLKVYPFQGILVSDLVSWFPSQEMHPPNYSPAHHCSPNRLSEHKQPPSNFLELLGSALWHCWIGQNEEGSSLLFFPVLTPSFIKPSYLLLLYQLLIVDFEKKKKTETVSRSFTVNSVQMTPTLVRRIKTAEAATWEKLSIILGLW